MAARLTPLQRAELLGIIADSPYLSHRQVANVFHSRVGLKLHRATVQTIRRRGGYKVAPANGHLTPEHRAVLEMLVSECGEDVSYREVAEQFEAIAGRTISIQAVCNHYDSRRRRSGPKLPSSIGARIAAASVGKERRVPRVDNSPRIVRVARVGN